MGILCHYAYNDNFINKPAPIPVPKFARKRWRRINAGFKSVRGTPQSLLNKIRNGYAYTAAHASFRHERNFRVGMTPSLDFDAGDETSSFAGILQNPFVREHASFLYTTPSHTKENPRARCVFILDEPVTNPSVYASVSTALVLYFKHSDQSCKDPVRIFFGSKDCDYHWIGNRLSLHDMAGMLQRLEEAREREAERVRKFKNEYKLSSRTIQEEVDRQLDKIVNAPDGGRHLVRLRISKLFGGYVAAGYLTLGQAESMLMDAAMMNTDSSQAIVAHDINYGLQGGQDHPVQIPPKYAEDWGISLPA
jgi:hypothetical protein